MSWTTTLPFIAWALVFIALVVAYFRIKISDRITPILLLVDFILINLYFMLVVNFLLINYWVRFLPILFLIIFIVRLFDRYHRKAWLPVNGPRRIAAALLVVVMVGMGFANARVLGSLNYPEEPITPVLLFYPLETGMYVATNGGSSTSGVGMNDMVENWLGRPNGGPQALTYGVDFMEMTARGMMGAGFLSNDRNTYEGWDEPVYAPCPGPVVAFETGHADQEPFAVTSGFDRGNYVVIQCFEYYITLSNLRNGFETVKVGDQVSFSNIVGYIGTSGAPSLPHLHIHVTVGGYDLDDTPVPIKFETKYNVRNDVYVR